MGKNRGISLVKKMTEEEEESSKLKLYTTNIYYAFLK